MPAGIWAKCPRCRNLIYRKELERNLKVCPKCSYHHRLTAVERLEITLDENSFQEYDAGLASTDPLGFESYPDKLSEAQAKTEQAEAVLTGEGTIEGWRTVTGALDFYFMGGSMGSAVGEKVARAAERAHAQRLPLLIFSASGGARMQEGVLSLMQLAKTSAAIGRLHDAGLPYLSVMCDPTTGGVTASFAFLGDVILAEPGALIGFAGRLRRRSRGHSGPVEAEIAPLMERAEQLRVQIYTHPSPWHIVQLARQSQRPRLLDFLGTLCSDVMELHGDRLYRDDPALLAALARFNGQPVVVIGHNKGKDTKENIARNFGMPYPEGYRKALRAMRLAEKFRYPVISFVDTPGAYPGDEAEERGQAEAIARNIQEMSRLRTPVVGAGGVNE